jgi:hypothetical protein
MSFLSQGSVWQPSDEVSFSEEPTVSSEAGIVTELESRLNETLAFMVAFSNTMTEEAEFKRSVEMFLDRTEETFRGVRKSLEERRTQWVARMERTRSERANHAGEYYARMVRSRQMSLVEAQNAVLDLELEEARQMKVLLGLVQVLQRNVERDAM